MHFLFKNPHLTQKNVISLRKSPMPPKNDAFSLQESLI
ncbi:hypothetical protein CP061683_1554 [Chlamydia psittaci 06-1683]|nr:hypothetical protein CP061683_1554 [Chlamydia psittaci 06-1683]